MDYYQVVDDDVPPSKRPRTLNEQTPTPMPIPTTTAPLFPPPTDPHSIGRNASAMFFKTRLCQRFSGGSCPYGDRCTFAHGLAELRPSLSNWQDMTAGIPPPPPPPPPPNATATKICWMFQSRGACSYGEHCTFRHVADAGVAYDGLHHHRHGNGPHSGPPDGPAPLPRKPCFEWQSKGRCPYGDRCIFSHEAAVAGIQKAGDHAELNSGSGGVAPWRPIREAADEPETEFEFEAEPEAVPVPPVRGRGFQKMLQKKKIAGIYGDSLDEE